VWCDAPSFDHIFRGSRSWPKLVARAEVKSLSTMGLRCRTSLIIYRFSTFCCFLTFVFRSRIIFTMGAVTGGGNFAWELDFIAGEKKNVIRGREGRQAARRGGVPERWPGRGPCSGDFWCFRTPCRCQGRCCRRQRHGDAKSRRATEDRQAGPRTGYYRPPVTRIQVLALPLRNQVGASSLLC